MSGSLDFDESTVEALKILFAKDDNYVQQLVVEEVGPPRNSYRTSWGVYRDHRRAALSD